MPQLVPENVGVNKNGVIQSDILIKKTFNKRKKKNIKGR
jgi:hypothetical protein